MGLFGNLFGKKKDAPPVAEPVAAPPAPPEPAAVEEAPAAAPAAGRTYFFICSGNPSLIEAHDSLLKVGVLPWNGEAGHYTFSSGDLESRATQAKAEGLAFAGQRFMGSTGGEMGDVAEVLQSMRVGAFGDSHVAFAAVDGGGVAWVRSVYDELLKEAMSQGILPYYVYITAEEPAARFLLESFRRVA
jgi:hypothetical protein